MSTATTTPARRSSLNRENPRWSFGNLLRSEFTKLLTLRSTFVIAVVMIVIAVGFTALLASTYGDVGAGEMGDQAYASSVASAASFAQLVIGVLSVLIVSNEYSTNMIQSTFAASPKRLPVLAAKMIVASIATLVLSLVSSVLGYVVSALAFGSQGVHVAITDPKVLGAIGGTAFYLMVVALFSTAIASFLRNSAAGIAVMAGVFFVIPVVFMAVTLGDVKPGEYFLGSAAQTVSGSMWQSNVPDVGLNAALVAVWLVVPAIVAFVFLKKRDA